MVKPGLPGFLVSVVLLMTACSPACAAELAKGPRSAAPKVEKRECVVADFRAVSLSTHDPKARAVAAQEWLQARARICSAEQFEEIRANRSQWLGAADTPFLAGLLESLIAAKAKSDSVAQVRPSVPGSVPGKEPAAAP